MFVSHVARVTVIILPYRDLDAGRIRNYCFFLLFMKNVQKDQHVYFRGEERKEEEKSSTSDKSAHHHRHTSPPPPTHAVTTRK